MKTFAMFAAFVIATTAAIDWTRNGTPIFEHKSGVKTIQLGLRGDGVVVWREITSAESVTNSPAEPPPRLTSPGVREPIWLTNYVNVTNIFLPTNN